MRESLTRVLVCPSCHGSLRWEISRRSGPELEEGSAGCNACPATYPLHRGIGVFLAPKDRPEDLWEGVSSQIEELARSEPDKVRLLPEAPMEAMNPADLIYRGFILDSRGRYQEAKAAYDLARTRSRSDEQEDCIRSQVAFVRREVSRSAGPVVDIASGMGALLEELLPGAT